MSLLVYMCAVCVCELERLRMCLLASIGRVNERHVEWISKREREREAERRERETERERERERKRERQVGLY